MNPMDALGSQIYRQYLEGERRALAMQRAHTKWVLRYKAAHTRWALAHAASLSYPR